MRTEELLRSTLSELADRPYATEDLYASILKQTYRRPGRRRRTALVLAFAAVVVVVAIAIPAFLTQRTVAPADQRVRGNWNLIHTIDLPAGWVVRSQLITPTVETTVAVPVGSAPDDDSAGCSTTIYARGLGAPSTTEKSTPVDVNGHPGSYAPPTGVSPAGVSWQYADQAWANVLCGENEQQSTEMAQRVRFAVTPTRLPFRLRDLPDGYQVSAVAPRAAGTPGSLGAIQLTATDQNQPKPSVQLTLSEGRTEIPPGIAGWETDTVNGVPAVLSARDGQLCLNLSADTLCIDAGEGTPADLTASLWPAGRRELLVGIAQDLTVAKNLSDPSGWFDANKTVPE